MPLTADELRWLTKTQASDYAVKTKAAGDATGAVYDSMRGIVKKYRYRILRHIEDGPPPLP